MTKMCTFDQHYQTVGKKYNTRDSIVHMLEILKWPSLQKCRENSSFKLIAIHTCKKFLTVSSTYMPLASC